MKISELDPAQQNAILQVTDILKKAGIQNYFQQSFGETDEYYIILRGLKARDENVRTAIASISLEPAPIH